MKRATQSSPELMKALRTLVGPPVHQVESYPLGDYLYDRSKAREQLAQLQIRWQRYKESLSADDRETIEKIERIFSRKTLDRSKAGA